MTSTAPEAERPFFLRDNYAPVLEERSACDLAFEGRIPPELDGLYVRNGPNPQTGEAPHWFVGDGMLHGVRLRGGRALWYRNRFVRTRSFESGAPVILEDGRVDLRAGPANTHVVAHAGRVLALVEVAFPCEVTRELETVGPYDFDGRLRTAMTAHPKRCPVTGELHFFGYGFAPPYLTYHRADAAGRLLASHEIPVPGATMVHDFAITERHVVFLDLPVCFAPEQASGPGRFPYRWSDAYGARLGLLPRAGEPKDLRWFEIEPCYVFHTLNAYERDGCVVLDAARYTDLWRDSADAFGPARLHRFEIDFGSGRVCESALDDRPMEFPRIDERRTGLPHRVGYAVASTTDVTRPSQALLEYDLVAGSCQTKSFGPGTSPSEPVFVPAGAGEDEGYVLCYVYHPQSRSSELVILDASRFEGAPLARIPLPQRVPYGFHGSWLPET